VVDNKQIETERLLRKYYRDSNASGIEDAIEMSRYYNAKSIEFKALYKKYGYKEAVKRFDDRKFKRKYYRDESEIEYFNQYCK
jgi:predicted S18 family serine protease|tara:strand:+ start:49 stop:297 length:249 start_codon:yes stop_codon:yes gene_type:complete